MKIPPIKLDVLLATVNQVKIWHWQTRIPEHEIFGELYDELAELTDRFVEAALGVQGSRKLDFPLQFELDPFKNVATCLDHLRAFETFLCEELVPKDCPQTELCQLRDDMLETVDKALYKLLPQ